MTTRTTLIDAVVDKPRAGVSKTIVYAAVGVEADKELVSKNVAYAAVGLEADKEFVSKVLLYAVISPGVNTQPVLVGP